MHWHGLSLKVVTWSLRVGEGGVHVAQGSSPIGRAGKRTGEIKNHFTLKFHFDLFVTVLCWILFYFFLWGEIIWLLLCCYNIYWVGGKRGTDLFIKTCFPSSNYILVSFCAQGSYLWYICDCFGTNSEKSDNQLHFIIHAWGVGSIGSTGGSPNWVPGLAGLNLAWDRWPAVFAPPLCEKSLTLNYPNRATEWPQVDVWVK